MNSQVIVQGNCTAAGTVDFVLSDHHHSVYSGQSMTFGLRREWTCHRYAKW